MTSIVIRNIPANGILPPLVRAHLTQRFPALTTRFRGRGPREHGGRKYHESLPLNLAERVSLYIDSPGAAAYPKAYFDFVGWDRGKGKPRLRVGSQYGRAAA